MFPENPYIGQLHTMSGRTWRWDGLVWRREMTDCLSGGVSWGDLTYTNPNPVPRTIGGIEAGETFLEIPLSKEGVLDMWTKLLYPYLYPAFTSFYIYNQPTSLGYQQSIPEDIKFIWDTSNSINVQPNTVKITDITFNALIVENYSNNVPREYDTNYVEITKDLGGIHTFRIEAQNTRGGTFSRTFTVRWDLPINVPDFVYFRINGQSLISLIEIESVPANSTFTWQISNLQYVDFNRQITITDLKTNQVIYQVHANPLEDEYIFVSTLPELSGVSGEERVFRIRGFDVLGNPFSRECKVVWTPDTFNKPSFIIFRESTGIVLEEGDTLESPTDFEWTISYPANIQLNTIKIYDVTNNVLLYTDTSDNHHSDRSSSSSQLVIHNPITHLEPYNHTFRIEARDLRNNTFSRTTTIRWLPETVVPPTARSVTLTSQPSDGGSLTGAGTYFKDDEVVIRATANGQFSFSHWEVVSGGITFDTSSPEVLFIMPDNNVSIKAVFIPPYTVTLSNDPNLNICTLTGAGTYKVGTLVTVSVTNIDPLYIFLNWVQLSGGLSGLQLTQLSFNFIMPANNVSFRAMFQGPNAVVLSSNYPVGTLIGAGTYAEGDNVSINLTGLSSYLDPNGDVLYLFIRWDNTSSNIGWPGNQNANISNSFIMPNDSVFITAILKGPNTVTLSRNMGSGGLSGGGQYMQDRLVTISIDPDTFGSNVFIGWEVISGGVTITIISDYSATFIMPNNDVHVRAMFDPPPPDYVYYGSTSSNDPNQDIENTFDSAIGKISSFTTSWNFLDYLIFACPTNIHNGSLLRYVPPGGLQSNMQRLGTQNIHGKTYNVYFSGMMMGGLSNAIVELLY